MTTQLIEAARLANALNDAKRNERHWNLAETRYWLDQYKLIAEQAIIALRVALEQPAQDEPVALETVYETIIQWDEGGGKRSRRELARRIVALYTHPQAREPLTDEQILRLVPGLQDCLCDPYDYNNSGDYYASIPKDMIRLARAIEAAHGIGEKK